MLLLDDTRAQGRTKERWRVWDIIHVDIEIKTVWNGDRENQIEISSLICRKFENK